MSTTDRPPVTLSTGRPPIVLDLHPPTAVDDVVTLIHALAAAFPHSIAQMVSNQPNGAYRIEITHKPDDDPPDDAVPAHTPAPPTAPPRVTACDPPRMAVTIDGQPTPIHLRRDPTRAYQHIVHSHTGTPLARIVLPAGATAIHPHDIYQLEPAGKAER